MRKYLPDWFFVLVFPLYVVAAGIVVANIFLFSNTGSIAQENGSKEIKLSFEQYGGRYSRIESVNVVEGKLFIEASRNGDSYVNVDGKEIFIAQDNESLTSGPILVGDDVLFTKTASKPFLVADGKEYPLYTDYELASGAVELVFPVAVNVTQHSKFVVLANEDEALLTFEYDSTINNPAVDPDGRYEIIDKVIDEALFINSEINRLKFKKFKLGIPVKVDNKYGFTFSYLNEDVATELKALGYEYLLQSSYLDYLETVSSIRDEDIKKQVYALIEKVYKESIVFDAVDLGENYDYAKEPKVIAGKLAYAVEKNGKKTIIYDGKDVGENYEQADNHQNINGKLFFNVYKDGKRFIVYDGIEYGKEYDDAFEGFLLGDEFAYFGTLMPDKAKFQKYLNYEGVRYGTGLGDIYHPVLIDGELAYSAHDYLGKKYPGIEQEYPTEMVVYKGQNYGLEYDRIWGGPWNINNKLAFIAGDTNTYRFVYDGQRTENYYSGFDSSDSNFLQKDGDTFFLMRKEGEWYLFHNEKSTKLPYTNPHSLKLIDGKLAYGATKNDKTVIVYDGIEIGSNYQYVEFAYYEGEPLFLNNKLVFFAQKGLKKILVYGNQEIGTEYDYVSLPFNYNGKLGFIATVGNESFMMLESE